MRVTFREVGLAAVGANGKNAASETAEDSKVRWNGIGCVMQKMREAGM